MLRIVLKEERVRLEGSPITNMHLPDGLHGYPGRAAFSGLGIFHEYVAWKLSTRVINSEM